MRHFLRFGIGVGAVVLAGGGALAPAAHPFGVRGAAPPRALVTAGSLTPCGIAGLPAAGAAAVAVAPVAAAAQHHLHAAARAQEQAG